MQLRHLRYFVGIVEAGSISRAAEALHVAQPALSLQLGELERKLGVTLFTRSTRGVQPTPAGKALYREAQQILRQTARLSAVIKSNTEEPEGAVSIGMSSTFATYALGPLIVVTKARHPKVRLKLTVSDSETVRAGVTSGKLDLGLVFEDIASNRFQRRAMFRHRLYCMTIQPGANDPGDISLGMVAKHPLVLAAAPNVTRTVVDRAFAEAGLVPDIVIEIDQFSTMLTAVRQGIGAAILPKADYNFEDTLPGIPPPRAVDPPLALTSSIIWRDEISLGHAASSVREVLSDFLNDHLGSRLGQGIEQVAP